MIYQINGREFLVMQIGMGDSLHRSYLRYSTIFSIAPSPELPVVLCYHTPSGIAIP